ncbi:DMT family transporter [Catenovulum sp. 2E275]|uniref:DMT family transporter n=1 Tax=Catenovulum sp. 2E275 TaxID=2980497 RepID=UPI0021D1629E|nr:DMT family transporter [Catenovulum sp. 2E275]MCU4674841.1 DMT family transporter [Catenovulum sp. 2E275]
MSLTSPAAEQKMALLQIHLGVLLLGGTALFSKLIPLPGDAITFARSVIAALFLMVLVKSTEGKIRLNNARDVKNGIILGVLMAVHWVTYFLAMQYSTVATGVIALYTYPVMVVLFEPLLHKQKIARQDLLMAFIVLIGVILLVPEFSLKSEYTLGILLGVFSAALFAARNIMNSRVFSHYSGTKNMMFQAMVVAIVLLPFEIHHFNSQISASTWGLLVLLGIVFTALPHSLIVSGLRFVKAKTMSLVSCLAPLYSMILAAIILAEHPNWQTMLGGALVVSAAIYETLVVHKQK